MNVYREYTPPAGAGGLFLKLEDGKPVKVRIMSEPFLFQTQFDKNSPIQTKYAWAVYNFGEDKGQILQLPITGFKMIQDLAADDDWGDPSGYDLKITRTGTGLDTKYSVTPNPNKTPITDEMKAAAKDVNVQEGIKNAIPLSQVVGGVIPPAPAPSGKESSKSDDVVIEDVDDNEVDLSAIPF